jgi:hypothetical protein
MPYIYRVENKLKKGCYWGKHYDKKICDIIGDHFWKCNYNKHPIPEEDKGIKRYIKRNEICGFKTKKQALKWFTFKELKGLLKIGYKLKKIKVKEITAIGQKQVLAIR